MCLGDEIGGNNPQETTQVDVQKKVCVNKDGGKVTLPCVLPPLACRVSSRMRNRGESVAALGEKRSTQQNLEGSGAMWSLWKTRNDMVFNAKLVKDPGVVVLKMLAFVRHWKMLQRGKDSPKLEEVVKLLEREAGRVAI